MKLRGYEERILMHDYLIATITKDCRATFIEGHCFRRGVLTRLRRLETVPQHPAERERENSPPSWWPLVKFEEKWLCGTSLRSQVKGDTS